MPKLTIHSPVGTFDAADRQRAAGALTALGLGCEALPPSPMVLSTVWTDFADYARMPSSWATNLLACLSSPSRFTS